VVLLLRAHRIGHLLGSSHKRGITMWIFDPDRDTDERPVRGKVGWVVAALCSINAALLAFLQHAS
jgi:hypothetical protein